MFPRRGLGLARCDKMSKQQSLFRFLGGKHPLSESADEKTEKRKEQKKTMKIAVTGNFCPSG